MEFSRDRLTWVAYVVLAWFAYVQAATAPGQALAGLTLVQISRQRAMTSPARSGHVS